MEWASENGPGGERNGESDGCFWAKVRPPGGFAARFHGVAPWGLVFVLLELAQACFRIILRLDMTVVGYAGRGRPAWRNGCFRVRHRSDDPIRLYRMVRENRAGSGGCGEAKSLMVWELRKSKILKKNRTGIESESRGVSFTSCGERADRGGDQ